MLRLKGVLQPRVVFLLLIVVTELLFVWRLNWVDKPSKTEWLDAYHDEPVNTNAISFLIKILEQKPSILGDWTDKGREKFGDKLKLSQDTIKFLPSAYRAERRRENAVMILEKMGPTAESAIPALIRIFRDPSESMELRNQAMLALQTMGEKLAPVMPELIHMLDDPVSAYRWQAAATIGLIGPKGKTALPALLQATKRKDSILSINAAYAVWQIAKQTNVVLPVFTNFISATDLTIRMVALECLRRMGLAAHSAGILIPPLLDGTNTVIRQQGEKTLRAIDPALLLVTYKNINSNSAAILEKITQTLTRGQYREQMAALDAIRVFGTNAAAALPTVVELLGQTNRTVNGLAKGSQLGRQIRACRALIEMGPDASSSVGVLQTLLQTQNITTDEKLLIPICQALGKIGPAAIVAVGDLKVLRESCLSTNSINPLMQRYMDRYGGLPKTDLLFAATEALIRLAPLDETNSVTLLKTLAKEERLRLPVLVTLWRAGVEQEPPVAALIQALGQNYIDPNNIELLGDIGLSAKEALPVLKKIAEQDTDIGTRRTAAIAIRKLDPVEADKLGLPGWLMVP